MINWDQHLRTHREQLEVDLSEKENQKISANKMITNYNQSWELLKECMEIIEENNKKWKAGQEERDKQTTKKERIQRAKQKSLECKKQEVQRKITSMMEKLPRKERDKIESEERTEI